jgi:hypothetical protein
MLWEDLTVGDKIKLFSYWSIISILANTLQMFGSLSNLIQNQSYFDVSLNCEVMIGLGCMFAWFGLIKYMETTKEYSILGRTLSLTMPNVARTMISTLPMMMGYAFFGLAIFWRSNRFSSTAGSLFTLYALMNGDMVYDSFNDIKHINYLIAQIYLYSFIFFSICVISSLFVAVIEDGYITAKYASKLDMFYGTAEGKAPLKDLTRKRFGGEIDGLKLGDVEKIDPKEAKSKAALI